MIRILRKLWKNRAGATAVEYGLLGFLISLGAILALQVFGDTAVKMYFHISDTVDEPVEELYGSGGGSS